MVLQTSILNKIGEIRRHGLVRLLRFLKPHRGPLTVGFLALLVGAASNLVLPQLLKGFIDTIGSNADVAETPLTFLVGMTIAVFLLQGAAFYVRARQFGAVSHRIAGAIRATLYRGILRQEAAFFDAHRFGDLATRLSSEVQLVQDAVGIRIAVIARYGLQVVVGTILMGFVSGKLTAALLCALIILVVVGSMFARSLRRASKALNTEIGTLTGLFTEALSGVRFLQAHTSVGWMTSKLDALNRVAVERGQARVNVSAEFQSFVSFLLNSSLVLLGVYGIKLVTSGELGAGDFGAFVSYAAIVAVSFSFLIASFSELSQAFAAWERILEVLPADREIETTNHSFSSAKAPEILFENVSFAYSSESPLALSEVNFRISPGQRVALVGRSGSGKSTLFSLLLGFYRPTTGRISITFVDQAPAVDRSSLLGLVAYVPQDPQLFGLSVRDNLLVSAPNASDSQLMAALKQAQLYELFANSAEGGMTLDSIIGERGMTLSSGQRQRLALARAFLSNAKVILLDEPTANLDAENETAVQNALSELFLGRTTITIAHNFSTIMKSDIVFVLDEGRIVESGIPSKLMTGNGLFHHLASLQQGDRSQGASQ